ncbi:MAG: hypothetical protein M3Z37_07730 [Candidatus Eremiobacteraeota bacterium]|nr:hypothetical protein [Candidatus Eremiobacteraeota bacterium]
MKFLLSLCCVLAVISASARTASACNQKLADAYDQKIRVAIDTRNYSALARYAVQQAGIYHVCAAETSGHMRTRYMLGEAASWDQAAESISPGTERAAERLGYARKAMDIAKPIAAAADSTAREKKAANAILWTLHWVHGV